MRESEKLQVIQMREQGCSWNHIVAVMGYSEMYMREASGLSRIVRKSGDRGNGKHRHRVTVCLSYEQKCLLEELGGANWLRSQLATAVISSRSNQPGTTPP